MTSFRNIEIFLDDVTPLQHERGPSTNLGGRCVCQWTYSTVVGLFAENRRASSHDVCRKLCQLSTVTRLWYGWPNIRGSIPCRVKTDISFFHLSDRLWEQSITLIQTQNNVMHFTGTPEDGRWRMTCTNKPPRGCLFYSLLVNCPRHFGTKCVHTDTPFAFSACLQSHKLPHTKNCTFCRLCDTS
jgi:hypothetical protein